MILSDLKASKECPEWLTEEGFATLSKGYLLNNETPKGLYQRLSKTAAKHLNRPDLEARFFDVLWKGWLCPASPVASNLGSARGLPISCFGNYVGDETTKLFDKYKEVGMLSKMGGGLGKYYGKVRGRGMPISTGGVSDGVIPWMKIDNEVINAVSQGGVRRGSIAAYLDIEHPDVEDFIDIRRQTGDISRRCLNVGFHHGVCISDEFMNRVLAGEGKDRELFKKVLHSRVETGEPYLMFKDTANRNKPQMYIDKDMTIVSSQLCVAPDTELLTDKGYVQISLLDNRTVNVWNGQEFTPALVKKTGERQKLLCISFSNGKQIKCTPYHKFHIKEKGEIEAHLLLEGDEVIDFYIDDQLQQIIVTDISEVTELSDTYCFNEPKEHKGVLNGILTGNCNEIFEYSDEDHTFTCCLSSLNLAKYDEWKNSDVVELGIYFLDGVITEFLTKAKNIEGIECATRFAEKARSIGLGVLGWHTLLQQKLIPFESFRAMQLNNEIFKLLQEKSLKAAKQLAVEYGEPEWCKGYGVRNTTRLAVAPTTSNALISGGVSQGIEPIAANYYAQKSAKGTFIRKNPTLEALLEEKGHNTPEVWEQIARDGGSVKKLSVLDEEEKKVFLTAREINQMAIIQQAAQRQKYIDQGQSVNLFFSMPQSIDPVTSKALGKYIWDVHVEAWKLGLKGLYYLKSESVLKADVAGSACLSCEG